MSHQKVKRTTRHKRISIMMTFKMTKL